MEGISRVDIASAAFVAAWFFVAFYLCWSFSMMIDRVVARWARPHVQREMCARREMDGSISHGRGLEFHINPAGEEAMMTPMREHLS